MTSFRELVRAVIGACAGAVCVYALLMRTVFDLSYAHWLPVCIVGGVVMIAVLTRVFPDACKRVPAGDRWAGVARNYSIMLIACILPFSPAAVLFYIRDHLAQLPVPALMLTCLFMTAVQGMAAAAIVCARYVVLRNSHKKQ